jgi:hypothetical protein
VISRDEFIIEVWQATGKEVVSASELNRIEDAVVKRFGSAMSPASIARVLADHGARLGHPEVLQADARWREKQSLFTAEDLEFSNIEAALKLINRVEQLWQGAENDEGMRERLRQAVRSLKTELDSFASSKPLAAEVSQWITVWLQTPQIFAEWLDLRQNTAEFRERFQS